jgi:alkyl hydroperoxide reductase subunit AhpC
MSMIGQGEPQWCAAHLNGEEVNISREDFQGKWHVLYWYPLDFTFVCPTEIRGFQSLLDAFRAGGVEVIGASTDSFYSHKHWFADRKTFPDEIILASDSRRGIPDHSRASGSPGDTIVRRRNLHALALALLFALPGAAPAEPKRVELSASQA